jgi:sugar phosphate isomerase/epimerase
MLLDGRHLTYCLNIHSGETFADILKAVRTYPPRIREWVGCSQPFGLGLRIGERALAEAEATAGWDSLRSVMDAESLYVFTLNGFPYGRFHDVPVKTSVYEPDWRSPLRRDYTIRLAHFLAHLLPDGVGGSISTVPVAYRAAIHSDAELAGVVRNLADCAVALAGIYSRTGKEIQLGLEPEPDCWIDTTLDALQFFQDFLIPQGVARVQELMGKGGAAAEEVLRRHLGYCVDTCHFAVQFESPAEAIRRLVAAGIRISKVQLSAALQVCPGPDLSTRLAAFQDAVYLHQVRAGREGVISQAYPDLPEALGEASRHPPTDEWRIHFHVPLHWAGDGAGLRTTRDALDPDFWRELKRAPIPHWEIETYTYSVLPDALRALPLAESIAEEYRWVLSSSGIQSKSQ